MTQTVTVVTSSAVTPTLPDGSVTRTTDDAILVGVWSTAIEVDTTSTFVAIPGSGGSLIVQLSDDGGLTWRNVRDSPFTSLLASGVSPGATRIRASAIGSTGTLVVDTPIPEELGIGGGTNSTYTEAQLDAMESGGTLVPDTWYAASDSTIFGLATSASTLARVDFDALALAMENGIATYAAGEIEKLAGVPATLTALLALAEVTAYPRPFVIAQSDGETPPLVFTAAAFTTLTASDQGSNIMRLTSAGVHNVGASAVGKYLWIQTTAGVPSGFYEITARGVTTEIEVDVTAAYGSLIASTTIEYVGRTDQFAQASVVQVPGGTMGANGKLEVEIWARSSTSTANSKIYQVAYGTDADGDNGTACANGSFANAFASQPAKPSTLLNVGAVDSQQIYSFSTTHTVAPPTATIDTDQNFYVSIRLRNGVVDEDVMLMWRITLTPGV